MEAKEIFKKRLRSARLSAGLSMDKLVERMDLKVTKNTIKKYENGEMQPLPGVLKSFSRTLNVPLEYFYRPFTTTITLGDFRKRQKLPPSEERKLRGIIEISIENYIETSIENYVEIEQLMALEHRFDHNLKGFVIYNSEDTEMAAEKLLTYWNLGYSGLSSVYDILESQGIKVIEIEGHDHFDGFSTIANGTIPVIVVKSEMTNERKRLTALHELGHIVLDFDSKTGEKEIEKLCYRFAAAMLLPRKILFERLGNKRHNLYLNDLAILKTRFGISAAALAYRLRDLGIINDFIYNKISQEIKKDKMETKIGKYQGTETTTRFRQLVISAVSEGLISLSKAKELTGENLIKELIIEREYETID